VGRKRAMFGADVAFPDSWDARTWENYQLGILAGTLVYIGTVITVIVMLVAGGSFTRMQEQVSASCCLLHGERGEEGWLHLGCHHICLQGLP
jgi:hypothetical protein